MELFVTRKGSPCIKCLVRSTCTYSFISGSGCKKLAEFIVETIENESGKPIKDKKDSE
jgi:hypothetical protein